MITDLLNLKDLPPGEYTTTIVVHVNGVQKRAYLYAEDTNGKAADIHLIGFQEFEQRNGSKTWSPHRVEARPKLKRSSANQPEKRDG